MPLFSIITPVFNPPREAFEACVESVRAQSFGDWEWCLANDASTVDWLVERLARLEHDEPRVKVVHRALNGGIVAASNDAISLATGEFLVLLDNDDALPTEALTYVHDAVRQEPLTDYVYSDEDKITADGVRFDEFAKPDWSPERLLAQNYTSHLSVLRRTLVDEVGRFRTGFDGSQDYDLVLRVIERARRIVHVPHVLYHWRSLPTSTASAASAKPYAFHAALKAVGEHLARTGVEAEVSEAGPSLARIRRTLTRNPAVTIVLPLDGSTKRIFGVETALSTNVLNSLMTTSTYNNFEVVVVATPHVDEQIFDNIRASSDRPLHVVRESSPFHLNQFLNIGLIASRTRLAVLLDQHCEFIEGDWLETLLGYIEQPGVAAVSPLIVDEFGGIISAGIGFSPVAHHIAAGQHTSELGPVGMFAIARECLGVSTRCSLVDVVALKSVGGLSPECTTRIGDFDLAAKLHEAGYHAVSTPLARVRSFEDSLIPEPEWLQFESRWSHRFGRDPFTRIDTRAHDSSSREAFHDGVGSY